MFCAAILGGAAANHKQTIEWLMPHDTNPPFPIFNDDDSVECQETVEGWYEQAKQYHKEAVRLNQSYADVLGRQIEYGVELVMNQEFYEWASLGIGEQELEE